MLEGLLMHQPCPLLVMRSQILFCLSILPLSLAAAPYNVRSFLESTHQVSAFFARDFVSEKKTTVSHIDKGNGTKEGAKYTRLPPNTYCKDRSAVVAGDQDLYNKPSTNTHPFPGQCEYEPLNVETQDTDAIMNAKAVGYILCSGIKKPNVSKYISVYLVQPKKKNSNELKIHSLETHIKPDNYDAANDKSFSYRECSYCLVSCYTSHLVPCRLQHDFAD